MQLRGLVATFTILLILYTVWQLSFTWFVNAHESKMEKQAVQYMNSSYPETRQYGKPDEYPDSLRVIFRGRYQKLLDSTKEEKVTWWGTTYRKARESELNLGLDLQGGMNVTMEVELTGLLNSMSNKSKDPQFLQALDNANQAKANSDADFISLFYEEYKKLAGEGKLASIFSAANQDEIPIGSSDAKVLEVIRNEAGQAINRTFERLRSRIDRFGVAQPNINLEANRGIITVELAGVDDKERVRSFLQSTANLQFWEVYTLDKLGAQTITNADKAFSDYMSGIKSSADTTVTPGSDTTNKEAADTTKEQSITDLLAGGQQTNTGDTTKPINTQQIRSLGEILQLAQPSLDQATNQQVFPSWLGYVRITDTATLREYLNIESVRSQFPSDAVFLYGKQERDPTTNKISDFVKLYVIRTYGAEKAPIEGDVVTNARQDFEPITGNPIVNMQMNAKGASQWANLTGKSFEQHIPIAIVLDDQVYSAPTASQRIEGGNSQITGGFNIEEAQDLASILEVGKLPAPAKIVAEQVVGATLGADAIRGGSLAFLISFVVIFLLMLVYYNSAGWIANIALILNLLFTVGVLTGLGFTLTAPGIAGLVLTIGMAVDTNVIIYERIKEELTKGKGYQLAINEGYKRSLPPVLDAHITTLLTAFILFYFGLGPVKGFATTQILGLFLSLICGILVSRWVTDWFTDKKRHLTYFTGLSKRIFKHASFKFIEYRKYTYGISAIVVLLGIGAIFNGFKQGVEFAGGRSYIVKFDKDINVEQIRQDLEATFGENPTVKTYGLGNQLDITTSYLIKDPREGSLVDSLVVRKLYEGLQNHLPPISFEKFDTEYRLGSKKVLPTISDDLKSGAKKATFISLLAISLYILLRFRDWRYSLGTIIALLHDVLVTLAAFSFLKNVVPFPLELDQHFIAAVLTVIGFSMNDTVIVFDRIREYSRNLKGEKKETIINRAINDTLSRTIMTSLTVFLVILILFIFGGEVTRGFAFAMLIGVITGTYSSIFVAAPVLVDLAKKKSLGEAKVMTQGTAKATAKPALK